jgi:hypothetical protein
MIKLRRELIVTACLVVAFLGLWTLMPDNEIVSRAAVQTDNGNRGEDGMAQQAFVADDGTFQIIATGRSVPTPQTGNGRFSLVQMMQQAFVSDDGTFQVVLDEDSSGIPFINTTSLTDGDLLRYDATGEEWVNTEGRVTLLDDSFDFAPSLDTTTCFSLYDADGGTPVLSVDCTNEMVGLGGSSPQAPLDVFQHDDTNGISLNGFDDQSDVNCNMYIASNGAAYWDCDGTTRIRSLGGYQRFSSDGGFIFDFGGDTSTYKIVVKNLSSDNVIEMDATGMLEVTGTTIMGGSQKINRTDAGAADYNPSALTEDYLITADNTVAARAITISTEDVQSGSTANPRIFLIKDEYGNAAAQNLTVSLESGNIDGSASYTINTDYAALRLYCNGTNCFIY